MALGQLKYRLLGQTFNSWTVIRLITEEWTVDSGRLRSLWLCRCVCGKESKLNATVLMRGISKSCGCRAAEAQRLSMTTHGKRWTPEYSVWLSMKNRCYNPRAEKYRIYGGRGIRVCDHWREDFEAFLQYVGPRPSPSHSLDRINNDGNYEPGNVRWATRREQSLNKSNTLRVTINGRAVTIKELADETGISYFTLAYYHYQDPINETVLLRRINRDAQ